jgi:hypothetical protein
MSTETTTPSTRDQPIVHAKERPILFSGAMVRAILDGRKTQTRRIVKPQPPEHAVEVFDWRRPDIAESAKANEGCYYNDMDGLHFHCKCPYGNTGDRLWVRETWSPDHAQTYPHYMTFYRADGYPTDQEVAESKGQKRRHDQLGDFRWRPSIHMPRDCSRLTLEITDIGIERLNNISRADAVHEGCQCAGFPASLTDVGAFAKLWEQINGEGSWKINPWVWVVNFKIA